MHSFAHAIDAFLQSVSDPLVQLLQCFFTFFAVLGDMHQRLFRRESWIEEINPVLQVLDIVQRFAFKQLFTQIEQETESNPPDRGHKCNCCARDELIDTTLEALDFCRIAH